MITTDIRDINTSDIEDLFPPISERSEIRITSIKKELIGYHNHLITLEITYFNDDNEQETCTYQEKTNGLSRATNDWDENKTDAAQIVLKGNEAQVYLDTEKYCDAPINDSCSLEQENENYNPNY